MNVTIRRRRCVLANSIRVFDESGNFLIIVIQQLKMKLFVSNLSLVSNKESLGS